MKILKPGFYINSDTIWVVFPDNTRYFLWKERRWHWLKSYSTYLESTKCKFLGDLGFKKSLK